MNYSEQNIWADPNNPDYDKLINSIKREINNTLSQKRLKHTDNVVKKALEMAKENGVKDYKKIELAALAHDMFREAGDSDINELIDKYDVTKEYRDNNDLAHGWVAAGYLQDKYNITCKDILNGVRYHTTGRKGMSLVEKIIFLADAIETDRKYEGVDKIRNAAKKGLDYGVRESLDNTIDYLTSKNKHIDNNTVEARQDLK